MFSATGLIGLLRFFVLIEDSTFCSVLIRTWVFCSVFSALNALALVLRFSASALALALKVGALALILRVNVLVPSLHLFSRQFEK